MMLCGACGANFDTDHPPADCIQNLVAKLALLERDHTDPTLGIHDARRIIETATQITVLVDELYDGMHRRRLSEADALREG